jgi:type IV pilus assembly protein PilV
MKPEPMKSEPVKPEPTFAIPAMPACQRGMSLIEVLISVLILGIGMLGIAAMQAAALRNGSNSLQQSQAVIMANAMMDAMRANSAVANAAGYDIATTCKAPKNAGSTVTSDQNWWITQMQASIGASACGAIDCTSKTPVCIVTVSWSDNTGAEPPVAVASRL